MTTTPVRDGPFFRPELTSFTVDEETNGRKVEMARVSGAGYYKDGIFFFKGGPSLSPRVPPEMQLSPGVLPTSIREHGLDISGLWIRDGDVGYAGVDESGLFIDEEISEGKAGVDASGPWFLDLRALED